MPVPDPAKLRADPCPWGNNFACHTEPRLPWRALLCSALRLPVAGWELARIWAFSLPLDRIKRIAALIAVVGVIAVFCLLMST